MAWKIPLIGEHGQLFSGVCAGGFAKSKVQFGPVWPTL